MKDWFSVGEFGKKTGLSYKALRIYEGKGILIPHSRSEGDHRVYSSAQIAVAQKIVQFKDWGFSLEQIKVLLVETSDSTLKELLERRLQESRSATVSLSQQIASLESVLASLTAGHELTELERSQVMENLVNESVNKLKRRGVIGSEVFSRVEKEVSLYDENKKALVAGIRNIVEYAKDNDILTGPGRGNSGSSLVLYSEGYSQFNPMKYDLIPEYFSNSKVFWMEVEYSRGQEIGKMCDDLAVKTGIEVIAFRSPFLDILKDVQNQVGLIDFDSFFDMDPMILHAPQKLDSRGLYGIEYTENYHAFQRMSEDDKIKYSMLDWNFEEFHAKYIFRDPLDFMIVEGLKHPGKRNKFLAYTSGQGMPNPLGVPELQDTRGVMVFLEDWDRIFVRATGMPMSQAMAQRREIFKNPSLAPEFLKNHVKDEGIRKLLEDNVGSVFMKAHVVTVWWHYKRTAILKSLWPKEFLAAIDRWEQKHKLSWLEFGYKQSDDHTPYLKA